jgi:hypothetical protein
MRDVAFGRSVEEFELQPVERLGRLQECARYCRRLAQQSDRPSSIRSLAALAAEFEAQAASVMSGVMDAANDTDMLVAAGWQI